MVEINCPLCDKTASLRPADDPFEQIFKSEIECGSCVGGAYRISSKIAESYDDAVDIITNLEPEEKSEIIEKLKKLSGNKRVIQSSWLN